jgi:hypothetical protein
VKPLVRIRLNRGVKLLLQPSNHRGVKPLLQPGNHRGVKPLLQPGNHRGVKPLLQPGRAQAGLVPTFAGLTWIFHTDFVIAGPTKSGVAIQRALDCLVAALLAMTG